MNEKSMLAAADKLKELRDQKSELQAQLKAVQEAIDEKVMGALRQKADVSKLLVDDYKKIIGG